MLEYRPTEVSDEALGKILELMRSCFPKAHHYNHAFLSWLYRDNPTGHAIGYDVVDGTKLVGHLAGVPQRVRLHQNNGTVILLLNVATHPDYRGKGLFLQLARKTMERAHAIGHLAIIGVANQNTIRGYEQRLGWQNVAGLDARISLGTEQIDAQRALEQAQLSRQWDEENLTWRLSNPIRPLRKIAAWNEQLVIEGASPYPGIRVRATIPSQGLRTSALRSFAAPVPNLSIGLKPKESAGLSLSVRVPEWAKPSPLRLIYANLRTADDRLDPNNILFSFLDFDAF